MLILRRKTGESIVLCGNIHITICDVEGERVKIGISAPDDVSIVREELLKLPPPPTSTQDTQAPTIPIHNHKGEKNVAPFHQGKGKTY